MLHRPRPRREARRWSVISFFVDPFFRVNFFLCLTYLVTLWVLTMLAPDISDPEFILWNQKKRETRFILVYTNFDHLPSYFTGENDTFPAIELKRSPADQDCDGIVPFLDFLMKHRSDAPAYVFATSPMTTRAQAMRLQERVLAALQGFRAITSFGIIDSDPPAFNATILSTAYSKLFPISTLPEGSLVPRTFYVPADVVRRASISLYRRYIAAQSLPPGLCGTVFLLGIASGFFHV